MGASIDSFTEDHVDSEVLHCRVEILFDRFWHSVDFVNEEDGTIRRIRQVGHDIFGRFKARATRKLNMDAKFVGDAGCKGRFTQSRRAVEKDVPEYLSTLLCCVDDDSQTLNNVLLTDHLAHFLRP